MKKNIWIIIIGVFVLMCFVSFLFFLSIISSVFTHKEVVSERFKGKENIAVVKIEGIIIDAYDYIKKLKKYTKANRVKAIIVRVNSPGGLAGPSQEIFQYILDNRDKKPFIASLDSVAASGGYYIASACNKVVSNPGTITGSIRVISCF